MQQIESLLKEGATYSDIARALKKHKATINTHIHIYGGKENYSAEKAFELRRLSKSLAGSKSKQSDLFDSKIIEHDKRCYTLKERIKIKELIDEGVSGVKIAEILGKSPNGINSEIRNKGGRENYDPYKAHQEFYRRKTRTNLIVHANNCKKPISESQEEIIRNGLKNGHCPSRIRLEAKIGLPKCLRIIEQIKKNEPLLVQKGFTLEQRVEAIEQQIEIIFDLLKEKM